MSFETIVIGTDGSEDAQRALGVASELAAATDGVVHVVCAHDTSPPRELVEAVRHLPRDYWTTYDPAAVQQEVLDKAASALAEQRVKHVEHLVQKHPADAILDVADEVDADLIVVGNRGTGWATRFARGSVSTRVAAHASRNILIIHA